MRPLSALLVLALQAALWNESYTSRTPQDSDKELIMLEIEPTTRDDRSKRSPEGSGLRFVRQSHSIPPEYLSLLQQLSPQQAAQQQQQQIQQLLVARDGSKQPAAARYVLSQDGRIVQESLGLQALQQQQQYLQIPQQEQPQQPQPGAPVLTPELEAFSRAQTQLQQDYHDAPIRAQIAGFTERPDPLADTIRNPTPVGPGSPAPQIFSQAANQALARHEARLRTQLQQDPSLGQFQLVDANGYLQQFGQQQFAQPQQLTQQPLSVASADTGRQLTSPYDQAPRQRVVYQAAQPAPQSQPQAQPAYTPKLPASRRPIGASARAQLAPSTQPQLVQQQQQQQQQQHSQLLQQQPQLLQQDLPQQYLLETSQPSSSVQYLDALSRQDQQSAQGDAYASLFSNPGRGLFSPAAPEKPSRSSIFVSRAGAKAPAPTEEQLPTVRIPSPANQRPLSRAELDALVNAGFSITPVGSEEPQRGFQKAKRTPLPLARRNHVSYQNQQDGVSYQYSPGSSDYNPATKSKRYAPKHEQNNVYRANTGRQGVVTYVMALGNQAESSH